MRNLLISSKVDMTCTKVHTWTRFEQASSYIGGIETAALDENLDANALNRLISGIPSPWARAQVFKMALSQDLDDRAENALNQYLDSIQGEWRGLMALLATHADRIKVGKPISLQAADEPEDLYALPSMLGRMLFADQALWRDPAVDKSSPFIQLIYIDTPQGHKAIGATSPHTIVFTGVDCRGLNIDVPWYDRAAGRLVDPTDKLTVDQATKLNLLLRHMEGILLKKGDESWSAPFQEAAALWEPAPLRKQISQWIKALRNRYPAVADKGSLDAELAFSSPFQVFFNLDQKVYFTDSGFTFSAHGQSTSIDLKGLLMEGDACAYQLHYTDDKGRALDQSRLPVHTLQVDTGKEVCHFPLPLSPQGLELLRPLLDHSDLNTRIKLQGQIQNKTLEVELQIPIDGTFIPLKRSYPIRSIEGVQGNALVWPNFTHRDWKSYFIYSEYPTNHPSLRLHPFYADHEKRLLKDEEGQLARGRVRGVSEPCVTFPGIMANVPCYEILRSELPIAGVCLQATEGGKEVFGGYLLMKSQENAGGASTVLNRMAEIPFGDTEVGIDLGSNNSCVWYTKDSIPQALHFKNQRLFLLGTEVQDPEHSKCAERHELQFFQNEELPQGQFKSWLHEHHTQSLKNNDWSAEIRNEVSGGMTVFEPNITILHMDERVITTDHGKLHYSMKWLSDEMGESKRKAFAASMWQHVCANLFALKLKPSVVHWAYPGAYSENDKNTLERIYTHMISRTPTRHQAPRLNKSLTESESVSQFAFSVAQPSEEKALLGIDVGGSTSDIMVLVKPQGQPVRMAKQSSLRLAAGSISKMFKASPKLRQALLGYQSSRNLQIAGIKNLSNQPETAHHYINAVLDRVDTRSQEFYNYLADNSGRSAFVLPAYITGFLLFYAGKLLQDTVSGLDLKVKSAEFLPFGKGGRIFDWLQSFPSRSAAEQYYQECFSAGYGASAITLSFDKLPEVSAHNKSEVAKGLVLKPVNTEIQVQNTTIIGETGYKLHNGADFSIHDEVPEDIYQNLDQLCFPKEYTEFLKFSEVFLSFAGPDRAGLVENMPALREGLAKINESSLRTFIGNDPEYVKAHTFAQQNGKKFAFRQSMLVYEALCYLETVLIPSVFEGR